MQSITERIADLSDELDHLITETEDIYTSVYEYLPEIEKEISLTLEEMNLLLEYFIASKDGVIDDEYRIADVLHQISDKFEANRKKMIKESEIRQIKQYFAKQDKADENNISTLIENVENIQQRIEDIELISLNAIIYSAKLGNQGRAFNVIANNIIKLSNKLSKLYKDVFKRSKRLSDWNQEFITDLNHLLKYNKQLQVQQVEQFEELFQVMFESLESVSSLLDDMVKNIDQAIKPIGDLMISIQTQDIIKQNMQFLADVLNELEADFADFDQLELREDKLDRIVFAVRVLDVVIEAVESIEDNFIESMYDLNSFLVQIESDLMNFKEDGAMITNFLSGSETEKNTIEEIFSRVNSFIDKFRTNLKEMDSKTRSLSSSNSQFEELILILEEDIDSIKSEVDFFNKLKLVSKIELARIDLGNNDFANELGHISDELANDIKVNDKLIVYLKDKLSNDLAQFETILLKNQENVSNMLATIDNSKAEFNLIEDLINDAVVALGKNSDRLVSEVYNLKNKVNSGMKIAQIIEEIKNNLCNLKEDIIAEKDEVTTSLDLAELDIYDQNLNDILAEFERRFVGINQGNSQKDESDSEEGELVLF